jgi:hypothetical protein
MKLFRAWLQGLPADELPEVLEDTDLDTFHYGSWLLERGYDFKSDRETTPLYWDYIRFQRETIVGYFAELADYIKEYGRSRGRRRPGLRQLLLPLAALLPVRAEGGHPRHRDERHELPAAGLVPVRGRLRARQAGDRGREPVRRGGAGAAPEAAERQGLQPVSDDAVRGVGARHQHERALRGRMGSVIEDSFCAPHDETVEIQDFITQNERLYSTETFSEVAVAFSIQSAYDWEEHAGWKVKYPFWPAVEGLVEQHQPFDVVVLPEGVLREDWIASEDLARYRTVVLPECTLIAYSPMATGVLSGTYDAARFEELPADDWRRGASARILDLVGGLGSIAFRLGTSAGALAVAWALSREGVTGVICGARSPRQVDGWISAADVSLDPATLARIGSGPSCRIASSPRRTLSPAGHRREKRDRLTGHDRRIQSSLEPDVFFVHEHVEEASKLTVLVEQARFKVGVELDRRRECFTNSGALDLNHARRVGGAPQHRGDLQADHDRTSSAIGARSAAASNDSIVGRTSSAGPNDASSASTVFRPLPVT